MKKLILLLFSAMISAVYFTQTIYVDVNASGANNGSSWSNAFTNLQNALAVAPSGSEVSLSERIGISNVIECNRNSWVSQYNTYTK